MKIVVLSDTHMPRMNKKLPERLVRELKGADAILHAGDWTRLSVYEELAAYAPTYGVAGNNDGEEIVRKFGLNKLLTFEGCRIGIVHGHGSVKRTGTEAHAIAAFKGVPLEAIVYGHSHIPVLKQGAEGSPLIFNPGSPTDKRKQAQYSFGIFRISDGSIKARHVFYANKNG
ncbi:metallophosphoesterase [Cohnella endophytica]|uniref:Phosphoesterase n=1 Tax=Cohnella endophytica TaxID=2419778 RepID=A0A494Y5R5_9BACL|nr:metallophosphoesterase family protein [Cohnella endophytica]RKP58020.1 metallophosphoesterase [Cohnella endophytica]